MYLIFLLSILLNSINTLETTDLIQWNIYDAKFMKPAVRDYYKYTWDAKIKVPQSWSSADKNVFEVYVRKFSRVEQAKKHLWLISGGPGSSTSGIEKALSVMLPDTAIYLMDNRGLGQSHPMCREEDGPKCQKNAKKCYDALEYSSKHISLHETAKDYNHISRLILKGSGGKAFMYGSSYGSILAYTAFKFDPFLYSGLLLEAFIPVFRLDEDADVRHHVINSCFKSETCRQAVGGKLSRKESEKMMEKVMDEATKNSCKSAVEFVAFSSGQSLNSLLNSYIRVSFYQKTGLRSAFIPILYGAAYCPDSEGFNGLLSSFHAAYVKPADMSTESRMLVEPVEMHVSVGGVNNNFFGGHIRFSEFSYEAGDKFKICRERGHLNPSNWADVCGMVSDYNEEYSEEYLYVPERPTVLPSDLRASPTRLVLVTGKLDTQTPHDSAEREFERLGMNEKYLFSADHAGHGVIDSWEVPGMRVDLLLSFTMTGSEGDKLMIEDALKRHNEQAEMIWKNSDRQVFDERNIWDFRTKPDRAYSWWKFILIVSGCFLPVYVTLVLQEDADDSEDDL